MEDYVSGSAGYYTSPGAGATQYIADTSSYSHSYGAVHVLLSRFYPDFLETHFILILSGFYSNFLNKNLDKIWIKSGLSVCSNFIQILSKFFQKLG